MQAVSESLTTTETFTTVRAASTAPEPGDGLRIHVHILQLNRVSATGRALIGAFAGRAGIRVETKLSDERDGRAMGAFEAEGKSSGGSTFAGDTDQAVQQLVDAICAHLARARPPVSASP